MSQLVTILNGPNLNLLGTREPELYGSETLADVEVKCTAIATGNDLSINMLQSNSEAQLIDWIQEARGNSAGIIINPAAFTHTSIAVLDALMAFDGPVIEVHISNIHRREEFRKKSFVSSRADGIIVGLGTHGYELAVQHMAKLLNG